MTFEQFGAQPSVDNSSSNEQKDKNKQEQADQLRFYLNRDYDQSGGEFGAEPYLLRASTDYPDLSQEEIVNIFLDEKEVEVVALHLNKFPEVDPKMVAQRIIEMGRGQQIINYFDSFKMLDQEELVDMLINNHSGGLVAENLNKFPGVDLKMVANKMIEVGDSDSVIKHVNNFTGALNNEEIADLFAKAESKDKMAA